MNEINKKIIDAIIKKAEKYCPDSLLLIGVYGSVATNDTHEKSDLDLLILINDEKGRCLSEGFILNDLEIGYDLYCTTWEMLQNDALCNHANISKLLNSQIVYVKSEEALNNLNALREKALSELSSDNRFIKASAAFENAKNHYAECFLTDSLSEIRLNSAAVIYYVFDALMLYNGKYFKKGVKRNLEELKSLGLPFDIETLVLNIIKSDTPIKLRENLTVLMQESKASVIIAKEKEKASKENLKGTYEEMFSNWRNKMEEAVKNSDIFSSFMNMGSLQFMLNDIYENTDVKKYTVMDNFDTDNLKNNLNEFDKTIIDYLVEYDKIGITLKLYKDIDEFITEYLK